MTETNAGTTVADLYAALTRYTFEVCEGCGESWLSKERRKPERMLCVHCLTGVAR